MQLFLLPLVAGQVTRKVHSHTQVDTALPFHAADLPEDAGYATLGWTRPGMDPRLSNGSSWLHPIQPSRDKGDMHQTNCTARATVTTCYLVTAASFWWGRPINLTGRIHPLTSRYHFSLTSPNISLQASAPFADHHVLPPSPWRLHQTLNSQIHIEGSLDDSTGGFFWFKPLFWAVSYSGRYIVRSHHTITSAPFSTVDLYPVAQSDGIQGAVGFEPTAAPVPNFLAPVDFEFYPV